MFTPDTPIKFTPRKDQADQPSSIGMQRPLVPKGNKDFKKILADKEGNSSEEDQKKTLQRKTNIGSLDIGVDMDMEDDQQPLAKPLSLFDLANKGPKNQGPIMEQPHPKQVAQTPTQLFGKKNTATEDLANAGLPAGEKAKIQDKTRPQFSQEQSDLASINPLAAAGQSIANVATVYDTVVQRSEPIPPVIKDIIDQIEKMVTVTTDYKTDTIVSLTYPPQFEGVNIVLTSYTDARGEFNIRFENLTQAAKNILDMQANQNSLRLGLQERGYMVHIITTTTQIETPPIAFQETQQSGSQQRGDRGDSQDQKQQRQKRENPEDQLG